MLPTGLTRRASSIAQHTLLAVIAVFAMLAVAAPAALSAQPRQHAVALRARREAPSAQALAGPSARPAAPRLADAASQGWQIPDAPAPMARLISATEEPNPCFHSSSERLRAPLSAFSTLALPVAGIAALVARRKKRAAVGAVIAGALYAVGATVFLDRQVRCEHLSGLIYIYTPLAATAGAVIATR